LFAVIAHKDSIWVFLALVNHLDLECNQVDIKAAFLNGDLQETIYPAPPEGSNIASQQSFTSLQIVIRITTNSSGIKDLY